MSDGAQNPEIPPSYTPSPRLRGRRPLHSQNTSFMKETDLNESNQSADTMTAPPHDSDSTSEDETSDDCEDNSEISNSEDPEINKLRRRKRNKKETSQSPHSYELESSRFEDYETLKEESGSPLNYVPESANFATKYLPSSFIKRPELGRVKETLKPDKTQIGQKFLDFIRNYQKHLGVGGIITILVIIALPRLFGSASTSNPEENIENIKIDFPQQDDSLWVDFESGVDDVVTMNRPSTFILLYQNKSSNTLDDLVKRLGKYAICRIRDCSKEPITITNSVLNSPEIIKDHGKMITRYRDKLQEQGVMIIKNLENVEGVSAQAFHSFCDEYTPLVERSLFIFTMKVKKLHGSNKMKFVEDYFRNKWTDIKIDTFNALITRISSMVIEINP